MKQKLWCCVDYHTGKPNYYSQSLHHRKNDSIETVRHYFVDWETAERLGWKCIRVEVEIKPI
jgi:hypothetical protein